MKQKIISIIFFTTLISGFAFGQTPIKLSFTGVDNFQHVNLNKIDVRNLDRLCDTTLLWPDTTISSNTLGINDLFSNGSLQVFQNSPNPVEERTSIKIHIPEKGNVSIHISDLLGRVVTSQNQELGRGSHVFIFTPGNKQVYLFTAIYKNEASTIKIVAATKSASNECSLVYQGIESEKTILKSAYSSEKFLFSPGDSLEMTGYYSDFSSILIDNPTTSKTYTFTFSSNSPIVSTSTVTNILLTTATCGGNVTSEGGTPVTAKGVCWSTFSNPTTNDDKTIDGGGMGEFVSFLTGLSDNTTYYLRAYAINNTGTSYGLQKEFTTLPEITIPSVTTAPVSNTTNISAQSGGTVTNDGGASVVARGVCWSTVNNPTITDSHTSDGTGTGSFPSQLINLSPVTFYYLRAYATNSAGTAYGNQQTFSTLENPILPIVTTSQVINITPTTATSGGNVASDGGVTVSARGICWTTLPSPTTADSHSSDGSGTGVFVSNLTGLTPSTLYYVRAYATNSVGTEYGNEISFTTLTTAILPTVTTNVATDITQTTSTSGGNVTSDGGATVTIRGVCWSTNSNPTINDNKTTNGSGTGAFISYLTGLSQNTLYYVRAYATNSVGTSYGNEITFTTLPIPVLPTLTTTAVTDITQTNATSGGNVSSDGGSIVTVRGVCWSTSPNPTNSGNHTTDGSGTGTFVSYLTGLTPNTLYYIRAYATNSVGTGYGNEVTFTTGQTVTSPIVTTSAVTNIAQTSATSGGTVSSDGGAPVTARGVCWSISTNPTIVDSHTNDGTGTGTFISNLTGLAPNTLYYVKAYATNSVGTAYGNEVSFTTLVWSCGNSITINHVAGAVAPVAKTVTYGTVTNIPGETSKCWITSNLGADHQATAVNDATEASAGWYWQFNRKQGYKHDGTTRTPNTAWIYPISENLDWQIANDPCALELGSGWHIPTYTEWNNVDGGGNWINWNGPYDSALKLHAAGDLDDSDGSLHDRGSNGYYWSSTQYYTTSGWILSFSSIGSFMDYGGTKSYGFALRCIKDNSAFTCGSSITINHVVGAVAPVTKTVTYGTVTNIPGETSKCWITSNLGADHQATTVDDATEASAGWYWQFNRKQGYKHDGTTRTPNTTWITSINENLDWQSENDPCTLELGSDWRIPTNTEWINVDYFGNWTTWNDAWNSNLKLHAAGELDCADGSILSRGINGKYRSKNQSIINPNEYWLAHYLVIFNTGSYMAGGQKSSGMSLRCIQDVQNPVLPTVTTSNVTTIAQTTASSGGNVTSDGGATVTVRGVCWSTSGNPTTANSHTIDGSGTGSFISNLTGLNANTLYYVRAYATNSVGTAYGNEVSFTTLSTFTCGSSITVNHVAGAVAPVTKTVTYGTVTNIPGETSKCWITSNLGADHQATAVNDATEASAGWYWQFNRKQGYKHDGTTRIPNTTWITSINESLGWETANDPCSLEFGNGWRIPTKTEWTNVDASGSWTDWNGPWNSGLKLHAAGYLDCNSGSLLFRGGDGYYWSSLQYSNNEGWLLHFYSNYSNIYTMEKADGKSMRCIHDASNTFYIGQSYGGGIVFYIDGTGQHGLISATSDQSTGAQWGCAGTNIITGTGIGMGQANTTAIVNQCNQAGIAARMCNDLLLNGYDDWFLPSKNELNEMYIQNGVIGGFASNKEYWSSSENSTNLAWTQNFTYGSQNVNTKEGGTPSYVRAIRSF